MRPSQREAHQLRDINFTRHYTAYAEGSVLVEYGNTKVVCNVSVIDSIPRFLKETKKKQGWLTAEYGMLPRATHDRTLREATRGKQSGRTQEIQRLIGRSLRAAVDLTALGEYTLAIDCDVIQADGGTRTAAISGSCVALVDALSHMKKQAQLNNNPLTHMIASVSVGIFNGHAVVDLDYAEDSTAETDMNLIMNDAGEFIEIQGTAEAKSFTQDQLNEMLLLGKEGIDAILAKQREALSS